jgi:hypothetical protein
VKFSVEIYVELTNEELDFLKSAFLLNRTKAHNFFSEKVKFDGKKLDKVMLSLADKYIIIIDNIGNSLPTPIGNKILDQVDRDKKITNLLNES